VDVTSPGAAVLVALCLCARCIAELARGLVLVALSRAARPAGPLVAYGLMSTGDVTLACAVSIASAFDGPAGLAVLAVAAAGLLVGELVAPLALRRSLSRAGEIPKVAPPASTATSSEAATSTEREADAA
jgi:hypothetical protein